MKSSSFINYSFIKKHTLEIYWDWINIISKYILVFTLSSTDRLFHFITSLRCPVGWGCRIHRLLLCRGVRPHPQRESWIYDTKQSDGEVPAMLELWGMRSTPSLPSLPGPLWPGVVAPDRALSMGWIQLTAYLC